MDKMREEMRKLSDATCDLIDAFKKFFDTFDNAAEVNPTVKEIIANSVKETMVKLMYGDDAYVGKKFPRREYYPYGRDNVSYYRDYASFRNDEERILHDEENEEDA